MRILSSLKQHIRGYHRLTDKDNCAEPENEKNDADVFEPETKIRAAVRLIEEKRCALLKMREVQSQTVMPRKIFDFLNSHVGRIFSEDADSVDLADLSWGSARAIQKFLEGHDKSNQASERFNCMGEHYFPVFSSSNRYVRRQTLTLPVSLWVRRVPQSDKIELEYISEFIGKGSFKKVFKSNLLLIDLGSQTKIMQAETVALIRTRKSASSINFMKGISVLRNNFSAHEREKEGLNIAGDLKLFRKYGNKIEARDHLCDGDILDSYDSLNALILTKIFSDVASALLALHKRGLVHSDVKFENILVKRNEERGYLADLDFLRPIGRVGGGTPGYEDTLLLSGIATPFHDIYALAICVSATIFKAEKLFRKNDLEKKRALARNFKQMSAEEQMAYRDLLISLQEVFHANTETLKFSSSYPQLREKLLRGNKNEKRTAMNLLNAQFPAFRDFLNVLVRLKNNANP